MKILYDGLIYRTQATGGINRYAANLIDHLPEGVDPVLVVNGVREINFPTRPGLRIIRQRAFGPYILTRSIERLWFRLSTGFDESRFDLAHPTYHFLLTRGKVTRMRCPVVLTVHDMIHEVMPGEDTLGLIAREKRRSLEAAAAVICISENTRRDLLERHPELESRVSVIPLATDLSIERSYGGEAVPAAPYFFFFGARPRYKNFDGLLSAFAVVASKRHEIRLCVAGKPFTREEVRRIGELKLGERIDHFGPVTDNHLAKLYRCSVALVYPSLYEGFGIPLLEAMACGTAVIAINCSSVPEVTGDAALLARPKDNDELADMMLRLLDDSQARDEVIRKGRARAGLFSWRETALRTVEVYRSVCRGAIDGLTQR